MLAVQMTCVGGVSVSDEKRRMSHPKSRPRWRECELLFLPERGVSGQVLGKVDVMGWRKRDDGICAAFPARVEHSITNLKPCHQMPNKFASDLHPMSHFVK